MSHTTAQQRQRTQNNPLNLGQFSTVTVRKLKGSLGPKNQLIGSRDTNQTSNGGFGGGTYNHWFTLNITSPAWFIIAKGGPRPQYINVSAYDMNFIPIEERMIFQKDSISVTLEEGTTYRYTGHVMGAMSDLYNNYDPNRFDKGNYLYYPLEAGNYLLCISTTRNEPLDYQVSFVLEFPSRTVDLLLEDYTYLLLEDLDSSYFVCDVTENYLGQDTHSHSLAEWEQAWRREHQEYDNFPPELVPLATQP